MNKRLGRPRSKSALAALTAAICGAVLAMPASAAASEITFDANNSSFGNSYSSDTGVADAVTVTTTPNTATFTSSQAITVDPTGDTCAGDGTTTVVCTTAAGTALGGFSIGTSTQNDVVQVNGPVPVSVDTYEGNDAILGSDNNSAVVDPATGFEIDSGTERLDGGPGTDAIQARGGNDSAFGGDTLGMSTLTDDGDQVDLGAGNDFTTVSGSEDGVNDVLQGGPGIDEVGVSGTTPTTATAPRDAFSANLTAGTLALVNNRPENDTVAGFEDYDASSGGTGGNVVTGTAGSNVISGDSRADAVNPLGGGDQVSLNGGDDSADTRDGSPDRVACGTGADAVAADQFDELLDCERVTVAQLRPAGADVIAPTCKLTKLKGKYTRTAFFKGFTPKVNCSEATTMTVQILVAVRRTGKLVTGAKAGDLVLAEKTYKLGVGNRGSKLRPSRRLGKNLPKRFKAALRVTAQDEFGNRRVVTKRTAIKAKAKAKKKKSKKKGSKKRK